MRLEEEKSFHFESRAKELQSKTDELEKLVAQISSDKETEATELEKKLFKSNQLLSEYKNFKDSAGYLQVKQSIDNLYTKIMSVGGPDEAPFPAETKEFLKDLFRLT